MILLQALGRLATVTPVSYGLMRRYRRRWIDFWANCNKVPSSPH